MKVLASKLNNPSIYNYILCSQESACLELYHSAIRLQQDGDLAQAKEIYREILESELMEDVGGASQHTTLSKLKYLVYKNMAAIAREQGDLSAAVDSYIEVGEGLFKKNLCRSAIITNSEQWILY